MGALLMESPSFEKAFQIILILAGAIGTIALGIFAWIARSIEKISDRVADMDKTIVAYFEQFKSNKETTNERLARLEAEKRKKGAN